MKQYNEVKGVVYNISQIIDYLDDTICFLDFFEEPTDECKIATQKLKEAVFWLTYSMEDEEL